MGYESEEEEEAGLLAYETNLRELGQHNAAVRGTGGPTGVWRSGSRPGYTLGLNRFSDMTWCVAWRAWRGVRAVACVLALDTSLTHTSAHRCLDKQTPRTYLTHR